MTKTNFVDMQGEVIYVEQESGFFSGESYKRTLEESEYTYWGELNDEGRPDGIGMLCRAFTELNNYEPELFILYIGEFSDGCYEGYGVEFDFPSIYNDFPNAIFSQITEENVTTYNMPIYEGYFEKGKHSGEGVDIISTLGGVHSDTGELILNPEEADYCLFVGNHKEGELDGEVVVYELKGVIEYKGHFSDGEYNGKGILYFTEHPGTIKYEGEFSDGYFHGKGTLYDENGKVVHNGKFNAGDID